MERGRGRGRHRGFRRGGAIPNVDNQSRLPPTIPNWFQNTSNLSPFQYSTMAQQQSPWQSNQNYSSFVGGPHFSSNDTNRQQQQQQQQPFQSNKSTHSAFPWM